MMINEMTKNMAEMEAKRLYIDIERLVAEHCEPVLVSRRDLHRAMRAMGETPPEPADERHDGFARRLDGQRFAVTGARVIGSVGGVRCLDIEDLKSWQAA